MHKINEGKNGHYQYLVWGNFITDGFIVRHKKNYLDVLNRKKYVKEEIKYEIERSFSNLKIKYIESKDHKVNMILAYLDIEPKKLVLIKNILINRLLSKSKDLDIQTILSKNVEHIVRQSIVIHADESIAKTLINDLNENVRVEFLKRFGDEYLYKFIDDKSELVRIEVAKKIDKDYLEKLRMDESKIVRMSVCERKDIPTCLKMIDDDYFKIRAYLATLDFDEISKKLMYDKDLYVREHLAKHCSNIEILKEMIKNDYSLIRRHIAKRGIRELFYLFENETDPLIKKDLKKFDFFSSL